MPTGTQSQRRGQRSGGHHDDQPVRHRRHPQAGRHESDDEDGDEPDEDADANEHFDDGRINGDAMDIHEDGQEEDSLQQLTKSMVRYAISCEHSRTSIRREAVKEKVLGSQNVRKFKLVFDEAQRELRNVFGMAMVELPGRDQSHISAAERKKKAASQAQLKSTNVWVLRTTLPPEFRVPAIISPSKVPTQEHEAAYVGLYTWLIAVITISGGQINQNKLERHLTRVNANVNTPVGKTADFLARIQKQGYIDKVVDKSQGDEDQVSFIVGPRGKTEIPKEVLASHIRAMYGENPGPDFEERLAASLGLPKPRMDGEDVDTEGDGDN